MISDARKKISLPYPFYTAHNKEKRTANSFSRTIKYFPPTGCYHLLQPLVHFPFAVGYTMAHGKV
jgi:hypothetical protein